VRKSMIVLFIFLALVASGCHKTNPSTATISTGPSFGAEISPTETDPAETKPVETVPTETLPTETVPEETIPEETVPPQTQPTEPPAPSIQITGYNSDGIPIVTGFAPNVSASNGFFWSKDFNQALSIHNGVLEIVDAATVTGTVLHKGKSYNYTFQCCINTGNVGVGQKRSFNDTSPTVRAIPGNDEYVILTVKESTDLEYSYLLNLQTLKTIDPLSAVNESFEGEFFVREFSTNLEYALIYLNSQNYLLHIPTGTLRSLEELTGLEDIDYLGFANNDWLYLQQTEGYYDVAYGDCTMYNFKDGTSYVLYTDALCRKLIDVGGVEAFGPVQVHNHGLGNGVCVIDSMTGTHTLIGLPDVKWHGRVGADKVYIKTWGTEVIYLLEADGTTTPVFVHD